MPTCAINLGGMSFAVDEFLKKTDLEATWVYRRGKMPKVTRNDRLGSGFFHIISDAEAKPISFHVQEAIRFLAVRESELKAAIKCGADDVRLLFIYHRKDQLEQTVYLPPKLLSLAVRLNVGIEITNVQPPAR